MGKKYIIELEEKPFHKDGDFLYRVKGFNSLVFDMTGIGKLTSYTTDLERIRNEAFKNGYDAACKDIDIKSKTNAAYRKGLADAWEAAKKIALMDTETSENVTGYFGLFRIMNNLTAAEAIAKIKAWEEKKQEIKIGDEVDAPFGKAVVLDVTDNAVFYLYATGGTGWEEPEYVREHKTGRNFAEITTALEKLRGKQE